MLKNFETFIGSFYRYDAYARVANSWRGVAAWYLAILCLVCAVCCHIKYQFLFSEIAHQTQDIAHTVPGLKLKQGRLLLKSENPLIIGSQDTKRPLLIIDTTANDTILLKNGAPLVVRNQDIQVYGFNEKETSSVPMITLPLGNIFGNADLDINPTEIAKVICNTCLVLSISLFCANFIFLFTTSLIQALFWAGIAYFIRKSGGAKPAFKPVMRAAALALTPSLAIRAATGLFGIDFPFVIDVLVVAIYFGYLYFAYRALFRPGTELEPEVNPVLNQGMAPDIA